MRALAIATLTLLCACVSAPPPGVNAHKYERDRVACDQEAMKRHDFPGRKAFGFGPLGDTIVDRFVKVDPPDDVFVRECMRKRGYDLRLM